MRCSTYEARDGDESGSTSIQILATDGLSLRAPLAPATLRPRRRRVIPRILHRIALGTPSTDSERYWQRFQALHPDWELRTWSSETEWCNFELYPFIRRSRSPAQKADLARLEILWTFGGVYVDWDVEPLRSLDPLIEESFFIGSEDGHYLGTAVIGCEIQHPAIRAYMEAVANEDRVALDLPPNQATGPWLATEILLKRNDVTVFPPEFFYPYGFGTVRPVDVGQITTPFTFLAHHWRASWLVGEGPPAWRQKIDRIRRQPLELRRTIARKIQNQISLAVPNPVASYVGHGRVLVRLPDGTPFTCLAGDQSISPSLILHGVYDLPYWRFLGRLLRPGDRVVEVGANVGLFTVRIAALVGRCGWVEVWEPDSRLVGLITDNLSLNYLSGRSAVHVAAVARETGHGHLRAGGALTGTGALDADGEVEVRIDSLDQALRHDMPIHLLKVDVEGGEAEVLDGAQELLHRGLVRVLDIEVARETAGTGWPRLAQSLRSLVRDLGASVSLIERDGSESSTDIDFVVGTAGAFPHVIFRFP